MNGRCRATKRDGEPCTLPATGSDGYCWAHSPENAEQRRRQASKAGKGRPGAASKEITDLKRHADKLAMRVLDGSVERADASVVVQVWNLKARLIELERRIREETELEARMAALERRYAEAKTGGMRR